MSASPRDLLIDYQREYSEDNSRFKAAVWPRQTGKDFTMTEEAVRDCQTVPKTKWMIAAPSERQAMTSLDKAKDWALAYGLAIEDIEVDRPDGPNTLMKSGTITWSNGSKVFAVPGKPDTVRGESTNVGLTEFAFFEQPDLTWRALYPSISNSLSGQKKIRIMSTPNGKSGRGARLYKIIRDNLFEPVAGRKLRWSCYYMNILEAVKRGLPLDVDELREGMDDPEGWAQEYMCEFLDSSNVLLPYDIIAQAESAEATVFADPALYQGSMLDLRLGIDFGRTNDPTVCWTLERVGDVLYTREVLVLRNMSTPDQEQALRHRIKAARRVCFDYTGPGIGLGDYLVKEFHAWDPGAHRFGKIELCTFTQAFKREIFPKMRRRFEAPVKLRVPIDVEVREDLHAMQQIVNNGNYSYEAPHTREGHSDRCTALALAVRAADGIAGVAMPAPLYRGGSGQMIAPPSINNLILPW